MSAPPAAAAAAATTCVHFKTEWVANGSVSLGFYQEWTTWYILQ